MCDPVRLEVTEYNVTLRHQRPLTIALLADVHDAPCEEVITALSKANPDLIAIAGDLVNAYYRHHRRNLYTRLMYRRSPVDKSKANLPLKKWNALDYSPNALLLLRECPRIAPTFFSLGNHEWVMSDADYHTIARHGVTLLDNSYQALSLGGDKPIFIGGLTSATIVRFREFARRFPKEDWEKRHHSNIDYLRFKEQVSEPDAEWLFDFEKEDGDKLLLSHHPEYWTDDLPLLELHPIDLVLSGHAHGGQIRLFGHGLFAPDQGIFPKYVSGVFTGGHGRMVVTRGLCNTAKIPRIGNPAELVIIKTSRPPDP